MNELEKAVAELITKAASAAEAAGKFAVEQLPEVAQQYVLYKGVSGALWVVLLLVAVLAFCAHFPKVAAFSKRERNEAPIVLYSIFGGVGAILALVIAAHHLETALLAFLAPKVLLLQWAASLVK